MVSHRSADRVGFSGSGAKGWFDSTETTSSIDDSPGIRGGLFYIDGQLTWTIQRSIIEKYRMVSGNTNDHDG